MSIDSNEENELLKKQIEYLMKEISSFKTSDQLVSQTKTFERLTKQAEECKQKQLKAEEKLSKIEKEIFEVKNQYEL